MSFRQEILTNTTKRTWIFQTELFPFLAYQHCSLTATCAYLSGAGPLRPLVLGDPDCNAVPGALCTTTRATERERPCEDRYTHAAVIHNGLNVRKQICPHEIPCSFYAGSLNQSFVLFHGVHILQRLFRLSQTLFFQVIDTIFPQKGHHTIIPFSDTLAKLFCQAF